MRLQRSGGERAYDAAVEAERGDVADIGQAGVSQGNEVSYWSDIYGQGFGDGSLLVTIWLIGMVAILILVLTSN